MSDPKYAYDLDFLQIALTRPSDIATFLLIVLQGKALRQEHWCSPMLERSRKRLSVTRGAAHSPCGSYTVGKSPQAAAAGIVGTSSDLGKSTIPGEVQPSRGPSAGVWRWRSGK